MNKFFLPIVWLTLCGAGVFSETAFAEKTFISNVPLSSSEIEAITDEASEFVQKNGPDIYNAGLPTWKTLTRDKLARMIGAKQLLETPGLNVRGLLIDQALAWDMVHFENLTDIKNFFKLLRREGYFADPGPDPKTVDGRIGYYSESTASPDGGALSALINCTPSEMWVMESADPVLWGLKNNSSFYHIRKFGKCVRTQPEHGPFKDMNYDYPNTLRGAKSAVIIEDRLSRQLLKHRCSGNGPDQCLGLLLLLNSLAPNHSDMPSIIRKMQVGTDVLNSEDIMASLKGFGISLDDPLMPRYKEVMRQIWREGIVLSVKVQNMNAQPNSWTKEEIKSTVDASVTLMTLSQSIQAQQGYSRVRATQTDFITNPWISLDTQNPIVVEELRKLAKEAGARPGCQPETRIRTAALPEYWYAYAMTKLEREKQDCNVLPLEWVAEEYASASSKNQPEADLSIAALAPWAKELEGDNVSARIRSSIKVKCPEFSWGADYWGICASYAFEKQREAEEEKIREKKRAIEQEAEKIREQELAKDPCANGTSQSLLLKLGYVGEEGYPINTNRISCKRLPNTERNFAVAVLHQPIPVDDPSNQGDGDYDLHLILANMDGHIVAQGREAKEAYSDAERLESLDIDAALYDVAPAVRAFGVRTGNSVHCWGCNFSTSHLSLFVQTGSELRKIWSGAGSSVSGNSERQPDGCSGPDSQTRILLSMGPNTHHGYADLLVTSITSTTAGENPDNENQVCTGDAPAQKSVETWIYDGSEYRSEASK